VAPSVEPPVEIRVAQGLYKPDQGAGVTPGDTDATFQLSDGLTLTGGYAGVAAPDPDVWDPDGNATILSGDLNDDDAEASSTSDNSSTIVTKDLTDGSVIVEGLTVTAGRVYGMRVAGGHPAVRQCRFIANSGGLRLWDANDAVVVACGFSQNWTGVVTHDSNTVVTGSTFEGNKQFGMEDRGTGAASLADCRFIANGWGGIRTSWTRCALSRCVFEGNSQHGIDSLGVDLVLRDCSFTGHPDVAIFAWNGSVDLLRCSFTGNAGAVDCRDELRARSCTFTGNHGRREAVTAGADTTLVDCRLIDNSPGAVEVRGETATVKRCLFSGNTNAENGAGALDCHAEVTQISNSLFVGNRSVGHRPGAVFSRGPVVHVVNCTFAGNWGRPNSLEIMLNAKAGSQLTRCIFWDGPDSFSSPPFDSGTIPVSYSNVQGGYPGPGNVFVDPCFVSPGYWASPDDLSLQVGPNQHTAVWVTGDYHLKSQAGHWDVAEEQWVFDDVTSACIDLGDPNGPLGAEPFPNGGYVNLGAYGGTIQASRSYFGEPVCETQIAGDINGDCQIDDLDLEILMSHWLMEDIGKANVPPTITIVSPQDGAELRHPEPLILRFEASDPDGHVIHVGYVLEHDHGHGTYGTGGSIRATEDGWEGEYNLSRLNCDGLYVLRAEAMDDDGAWGVAEITITLHR
jgi:hypothetical protein